MTMYARSSSRNGARVRLLAVHTTEGHTTATQLRDATWWTGSSHAINDTAGTLLTPAHGCVPYDRAAWTLRNGNPISENIEQCGWARWTRAEWLARPKLLDTTALWLADRSRARGIPLVKLTAADIKAGKAGVIGHIDWTLTGDGSHTDPGPGYPWDVVLAKAKWLLNPTPLEAKTPTPEDDMPLTDADKKLIRDAVWEAPFEDAISLKPTQAWLMYRDMQARLGALGGQNVAQQATIKELVKAVAALAADGDDVDVDALVARIGEKIDTAVSDAAKLVTVKVSVDDATPDA